ncbi:serine/threonine-protein phosphatase 7 long form homolog [Helianthus annuus]|uniref:serine/threonine-protein phosphatase 7 long form homolog n=1 Tax=Helianthus annuus TaxID=4232 RepID=UPI001652C3EF|nr:serine/threonine-protein phosphatase 7 long form homolog [Helianthus annuus]
MNFECHPGPINASVLFLDKNHRAFEVFKNPTAYEEPLNIRRSDRTFWQHMKENPVSGRVEGLIHAAGFSGILQIGYKYVDYALITALVERWRPETHTFHLPFGETTVTLQDVNVLWGLPIDGLPISGADTGMSMYTVRDKCQTVLEFTPEEADVKGKRVKSTRVLAQITSSNFSENEASDEDCIFRARQIIFYLIGCTIFPDNANHLIDVKFLEFLVDLPACSGYSWGGAVLALLYKNLCNATAPNAIAITGPVALLQVWAWERFCCFAPAVARFQYNAPLAARWKGSLTCTDVSTHCLRTYRSQLQSMTEATFNWRPYDDIVGRLPDICRSGMGIWRSCCPLLCYSVVEHHYRQRVMRQFGMFQYIPNPIAIDHNEHARLHSKNRSGKTGWNWLSRHAPYVSQWEARHQNLVTGELMTSVGVANDYMSWYMEHTVLYVSNPQLSAGPTSGFQDDRARVQMMSETMGLIHRSEDVDVIHGAAYRALEMSNVPQYTQYPTHLSQEPVDLVSYPRTQRVGRPQRRARGGRNVEEAGTSNWGPNFETGGDQDPVSVLATACSEGFDVSDLLNPQQNDMGNNNQFVDPNISQAGFFSPSSHMMDPNTSLAGFVTPASQMITFMPETQTDYQYWPPNQSNEDHRNRYADVEPNPLNWSLDLNLFPPPPNDP